MEAIILAIILGTVVVLLALIADVLEVSINPEKTIPTINIKFKKDSRLFAMIKQRESQQNAQPIFGSQHNYTIENFFGNVEIVYGEEEASFMDCNFAIRSNTDGLDTFYYYNADANAELLPGKGFKSRNKDYTKLRKYSTWESDKGKNNLSDLHRVGLKFNKINKDESLNLSYKLKLYGHYRETMADFDLISHFIFFRTLAPTNKLLLKYFIPAGQVSDLYRFIITKEKSANNIEQTIKTDTENIITLDNDAGVAWLERDEMNNRVQINWLIEKPQLEGTIFRLVWHTRGNSEKQEPQRKKLIKRN